MLQPSCGAADFIFLPSPDIETEGLLEFMAEHNRCGVRSSVTFTAPVFRRVNVINCLVYPANPTSRTAADINTAVDGLVI